MRHAQRKHHLNRFTSWRKATLISMARSVLIYQSVRTTKVKAQAVKPLIERLITLAKENTLTAKRRVYKILSDHKLVTLLFSDIGTRFANRSGGYVRVLNLGRRRGDNAEMAILELTEIKKKEPKKPKKEKAAKPEEGKLPETPKEQPPEKREEKKTKPGVKVIGKPQKPAKKFFGGIKNIFKRERDFL